MTLLVLMYQLRFIRTQRLRIMSDLMLTQIFFDSIFELPKNFYFQSLKKFCTVTQFLEDKKLSEIFTS